MEKIETAGLYHYLRPTLFGPVAIMWSIHQGRPRIKRVMLSKYAGGARQVADSAYTDVIRSADAEIDAVADQMVALLSGADVRFSLDLIRLDLCTEFQRRVLCAEHGIPRGKISSYGTLARHLGNAKASRAVGAALARNPFPLIIPCHRAIRSDDTLGGFQSGIAMKRRLLEMEGIRFNSQGRVMREENFFYAPDEEPGLPARQTGELG